MPPIPQRLPKRSPPIPKRIPPVPKRPIPVATTPKASTRPVGSFGTIRVAQRYRCHKCLAEHRYKPEKCQSCGLKNSLIEIPIDECLACEGTGKSTRGLKCVPCDGSGKRKALVHPCFTSTTLPAGIAVNDPDAL